MDRKPVAKMPTGVEVINGTSVRIRFSWNGRRVCETLGYPPTPQGIQAAAGLRATVVQLSKLGMLSEDKYAELFPNSRQILPAKTPLFGEYAQLWLDGLKVLPRTREVYKRELNRRWMPIWATRPMNTIRPVDARKAMAEMDWLSTNTYNRGLTLINAVFSAAVVDEVIPNNPFRVIRRAQEPTREIDPFSAEERDRIIAWLYKNYPGEKAIYGAFFEFAFYTGMRMTELVALRWGDIDFNHRTATIHSVLADKEIHQRTKNKRERTVRLLPQAMHALEMAKPLSYLRSEFVFAPPPTAQWKARTTQHLTNTEQTRYVFKRALRKLGIRDRRQRDTRHTFATLALMAGAKPAFIAQQLGHTVQTLLKRYAKWVNSVDDWAEMEKLENTYFGTKVVQEKVDLRQKPSTTRVTEDPCDTVYFSKRGSTGCIGQ